MKLLSKASEERNQTAGGVEADLRRCLAEIVSLRRIDPFPLGTHDLSDRLFVPEKLYGRDRESEALRHAFERVASSGMPELVPVSGYSGIGKSSVVNELQKAIVLPRGTLTPEDSRARVHLQIGRLLHSKMTPEEVAENIFSVVNQLNSGNALIIDRTERERVAALNLSAGQKTKASAAYASACTYLSVGMALIGRIGWKRRYDLALTLWLERAECEFSTGNFETAEQLISEVPALATAAFYKEAPPDAKSELSDLLTEQLR